MKNYFTNSYNFSFILLLLLFFPSSSFANLNYSKLVTNGSNILTFNPKSSNIGAQLPQASAPSSSPSAGTYTGTQLVTITTTSTGTSIRYTTDGTDPSSNTGTLYSGPVSISSNTILKSIAYGTGYSDSQIATEAYVINCETPVLTPTTGIYDFGQHVTMTSATTGATIYYTTDGSEPTVASTQYYSRITLGVNTTLRAIAIKSGMGNSEITTETYTILSPVAAPTFTPPAGTYTSAQSATITSTTQGAIIYYTTDGSTPTSSSPVYNGPVTISATSTIKAIAEKSGMSNSPVISSSYTILLPVTAPTFTPPAGTYTSAQNILITSATQGATIYYTLDGSTPTLSSPIYSGPVTISATSTVKAIAIKNGMSDSPVTSSSYTILLPVTAPTFTPSAGTYPSAQDVSITSTTQGATIYYTLDGSTPTTSSLQYSGPITIGASTTLKAIAIKAGMANSNITTAAYIIQILKTENPIFNPAPGNFTTPQTITIIDVTTGSTIRYTTDGSIPSQTNGIVYNTPITISTSTSFKAIAYLPGQTDSDVINATYTITLGNADSDGDGVSDNEDDYPIDSSRSSNNLFPATGFGSLAFEDNWPLKADYDMNDMVVDYQFNQVANAKNEVVEIKARFVLRAMGTTLHNGFGIELPVASSQVTSCVIKFGNGRAVPIGNLVSINSKGLEESNNPKAVVILFDDGFNLFSQNTPGILINTSPDISWTKPDTLNMTITFTQPINMDVFTDSRVYNPFIFTDKTRSTEIHLPDFPPTSLANSNLFNTGEDKTNPLIGKYYKTSNNLPWALNIYEAYDYPIEKTSIINAFLHFAEWAQSNGALYPDWYLIKDGYRKSNTIYTHP